VAENLREVRVARLPAEQAAGLVRGGVQNGRVAGAAVSEQRWNVSAGDLLRGFDDFKHGMPVAGAKI